MAAHAFVVDIAPEVAVVLGVRDADLLGPLLHDAAGQVEVAGVEVEQLDVVEDPFGIEGDAAHRRAVAVAGP